jgi:hypothetical protein
MTIGKAMMIIPAPQFTLARFNRSLAGLLRLSTDPELPGASPIVLGVSICCFRSILVEFRCSGMPGAAAVSIWPRHQDAISQMGATCDSGAEYEAGAATRS